MGKIMNIFAVCCYAGLRTLPPSPDDCKSVLPADSELGRPGGGGGLPLHGLLHLLLVLLLSRDGRHRGVTGDLRLVHQVNIRSLLLSPSDK